MSMIYKNFMEKCLEGEAQLSEINSYVERWNKGNTGLSLTAYLGMSDFEYEEWEKSSGEALQAIFFCKKHKIDYKELRAGILPINEKRRVEKERGKEVNFFFSYLEKELKPKLEALNKKYSEVCFSVRKKSVVWHNQFLCIDNHGNADIALHWKCPNKMDVFSAKYFITKDSLDFSEANKNVEAETELSKAIEETFNAIAKEYEQSTNSIWQLVDSCEA